VARHAFGVKRLWSTVGTVAILLGAIVLAEVPPLPALAAWIDAHHAQLFLAVGIALLLGFVLFFGGIVALLVSHGETLSHAQVEDVERSVHLAARPVAWRASKYRVFGAAAGRGGSETFGLRELKAAWGRGDVWRDAEWRRRFATVVGALLSIIGILGVFVVVGPPWLKVLMGGALLYSLGRLALGWRRN
jgi:hypothetical protein